MTPFPPLYSQPEINAMTDQDRKLAKFNLYREKPPMVGVLFIAMAVFYSLIGALALWVWL